jgi:hypothetical protein
MARYLQKTDSQEFAVANSDSANPDLVKPEPSGADLAVRIWGANRLGEPGPVTWKADSVFVYMIADLVEASRGSFAEESPGVMAAHFSSPSQALVAARRIQISILEFLACRPGQGCAAAVLIHPPATGYLSDSQREFVQGALGQAGPGQILLTDDVYMGLRNLPGAEFRRIARLASASGGPQTGLTELIWASPEHDLSVYSSGEPPVELSREEGHAPIGATRIVDSPLRRLEALEISPSETPIARSADFGSAEQEASQSLVPAKSDEAPASSGAGWHTPESADASRGNLLLEELNAARRPMATRTRVIMGVAAVVLIGALLAVFYRSPSPDSTSAPSAAPAAQVAGKQADAVKAPPPPERATVPPVPPAIVGKPQSPTKSANVQPAKIEPAKIEPTRIEPTKIEPAKIEPAKIEKTDAGDRTVANPKDKGETSVDGFSAKDIPALLQMAQNDVGSGNYEKAEYKYKTVLRLQPNNPDAVQGLHKLSLISNENNR